MMWPESARDRPRIQGVPNGAGKEDRSGYAYEVRTLERRGDRCHWIGDRRDCGAAAEVDLDRGNLPGELRLGDRTRRRSAGGDDLRGSRYERREDLIDILVAHHADDQRR